MENILERLGKRARDRREQLGRTQRDVADEAGVCSAYLSMIEGGKREPKLRTLEALAVALEMDVGDLVRAA